MSDNISFDDLIPKQAAEPSFEDLVPRSTGQEIGRQLGLAGRAIVTGVTSLPMAIGDTLAHAQNFANALTGRESRVTVPSESLQSQLTQAGVPEPITRSERAAQAGMQALTGTASMAKQAPILVANAAKEIPIAGVSAAMSQPAAEVVKDYTGSDLAATMAAIGTAGVTAGYTGRALNAAEAGKPLFTMEQVKQRASRAYKDIDNAGITVKPQSSLNMLDDMRNNLKEARMIPDSPEAITVGKTIKEMENIIGTQKVPFATLDRLRQMANDIKMSKDGKESRLGSVMVDTIDSYISKLNGKDVIAGKEGVDEAVKKITSARKDWRNASRAQVLEDALNVAEVKTYAPNTSESELIRRGFINIAANKQKMSLFTEEEQNIIKGVAKGGSMDHLLSFFGQFNPARSKLAAFGYGSAATGALLGNSPTTGAIAAGLAGTGWTADTIQSVLRRRAAQQAANAIASGQTQGPPPNLAYRGLFTTGLVPPEPNQ